MAEAMTVWSVGHSNHDAERLVRLLGSVDVEVVADVRSQPFSRFSPQFNRPSLRAAIMEAGLEYVFLGEELGGRPADPGLYDENGHVLYGEVAKSVLFLEGLRRLIDGANKYRVAMLCSEEDPTDCHRRLLVARVLAEWSVGVIHIRGDGSIVSETELAESLQQPVQPRLFGEESAQWRSTRSVLRSTAPRISSRA